MSDSLNNHSTEIKGCTPFQTYFFDKLPCYTCITAYKPQLQRKSQVLAVDHSTDHNWRQFEGSNTILECELLVSFS